MRPLGRRRSQKSIRWTTASSRYMTTKFQRYAEAATTSATAAAVRIRIPATTKSAPTSPTM